MILDEKEAKLAFIRLATEVWENMHARKELAEITGLEVLLDVTLHVSICTQTAPARLCHAFVERGTAKVVLEPAFNGNLWRRMLREG